jgi:chaperone LolA
MPSVILALLLVLPQSLSPREIVDAVSAKYGRLDSFSADFEQTSQEFSNQTRTVRGHVYLKTQRRGRFEYFNAKNELTRAQYFDGKNYIDYNPFFAQATQSSVSNAQADLLNIIQVVGNRESPWKNQFERFESALTSQANTVVRLVPKNKDLSGVTIEVDREFFIVRLAFTSADGQRNEFKFTNMKTAPLDKSMFQFVPPPGVKIVKE